MHMRAGSAGVFSGGSGSGRAWPGWLGSGAASVAIIDTHQHLWDLKKFNLPWLKGDGRLNRSFTEEDYAKAIEGLNVVKAVYEEVDVVPSQKSG